MNEPKTALFVLERNYAAGYTSGKLYGPSGKLLCHTLEDPRERTKDCKGCIPEGTYPIGIRYSPKFGKKMVGISNVPGFKGILVHGGNSVDDTAGCVLVGKKCDKATGRIWDSASALVYDLVQAQTNPKLLIEEAK